MRILVVHNDYGKYSGEEAVVDRFIADARSAGHEVETLRRTSKFFRQSLHGKVKGFLSGIHSMEGVHMMREALETFRPQVVNVHNLFPFISPAALRECTRRGVPVVMTVHNYRLVCPTGLLLRAGQPCEECLLQGCEWPCVQHNCEGSHFRSWGYAARNRAARRHRYYLQAVTRYCCLTTFQQDKLVAAGYPADRIVVIPNYVELPPDPLSAPAPNLGEGAAFIGYVGRMSREKGFDLLLQVAAQHPEWQFRLAGDSSDMDLNTLPGNVHLEGVLNRTRLQQFYREAACIVIPSRCYEGFPMVMLEAMASGKACLVPNHGAFPQIAAAGNNALLFRPGDAADIDAQLCRLMADADLRRRLGHNAKECCRQHYSRETVFRQWQQLLHEVAGVRGA